MNDAVKWGLIERNTVSLATAPRVTKREMCVFTDEQTRKFLAEARGNYLEALFVLAVATGAREGELLGLSWGDVDLQTGKMQIKRILSWRKGEGLVFAAPKTESSRRTLYLSDFAIAALQEHQSRQRQLEGFAKPGWNKHNLVFCTKSGRPIERTNLRKSYFRPLVTKAGLPQIRFHDLRHTAATLLFQLDVHPKVVQQMLGHSNISITLDTYSHAVPVMEAGASERLGGLLKQHNI
jgi:integrase